VASEDSLQALQRMGAQVSADLDAYCAVAQRLGEDLGMQLPGKLHRAGVWRGTPVSTGATGGRLAFGRTPAANAGLGKAPHGARQRAERR
jgi:hypothetical protein